MDHEYILYIKNNCIKTDAFCSLLGWPYSFLYQEGQVSVSTSQKLVWLQVNNSAQLP